MTTQIEVEEKLAALRDRLAPLAANLLERDDSLSVDYLIADHLQVGGNGEGGNVLEVGGNLKIQGALTVTSIQDLYEKIRPAVAEKLKQDVEFRRQIKGDVGPKGLTGTRGPNGDKDKAPVGPKGDRGDPGADGDPGVDGRDCT